MILDETLPQLFYKSFQKNAHKQALLFKKDSPTFTVFTYQQLFDKWESLTLAFNKIVNIQAFDRVFFLSVNRPEWIICDLALLALRAVDAPRDNDISDDDMKHIVSHSDPHSAIIENVNHLKRLESLKLTPKTVIILDKPEDTSFHKNHNCSIFYFDDLLLEGEKLKKEYPSFFKDSIDSGKIDDLITIIYTSGTSSNPKGVCLTHTSFSFQFSSLLKRTPALKGSKIISILPIWHVYERSAEYLTLFADGSIVYSKPSASILLKDIKETSPHLFYAVPRIFEVLYKNIMKQVDKSNVFKRFLFRFFYAISFAYHESLDFTEHRFFDRGKLFPFAKYVLNLFASFIVVILYPLQKIGFILVFRSIRKKFGKHLKFIFSAGAHLPIKVNKFFRDIHLKILEGYGMTEMAPVITARSTKHNVQGSAGRFLTGIEYYCIDMNGNKNQREGVLHVKSPQMMTEYYNNPQATKEAIGEDGFLNTGDIVQIDNYGMLRVIGRMKNIVVLANGENIETEPLEVEANISPYIDHSCVVGQDQKNLGILIAPNFDYLTAQLNKDNILYTNNHDIVNHPKVKSIYMNIIKTSVNKKFKKTPIVFVKLLEKELEINKELTATLKIKRHYMETVYKNTIYDLFHKNENIVSKTFNKMIN